MHLAYRSLCVVLSVGVLAACGFHLKGPIELPREIAPVFIVQSGADNVLYRELRALLLQSGEHNLTQIKTEANSVLNIVSAREKKRVVAVDDRGRARQYDLIYLLRYRITGKSIPQSGKDNINELHLKRSIVFDPDNVLAIGYETETLYSDMRKDSAHLILQRLQALGTQPPGEQPVD